MITAMVAIFMLGYIMIAMEHRVRINKSATAIALGVVLWTMYVFLGDARIAEINRESFDFFLNLHPELIKNPLSEQVSRFVGNYQILGHLGDIASILFFLLCAMTIVELIDAHGGFAIITKRITTKNKRKLLWIVAFLSFFLSSVLDNLTTAIVMVMLMRKLLNDRQDRWIFGGVVVIACNSGGAWSPIGDITTIMLWINENVTSAKLLEHCFLPSLVSMLVPLAILTFKIKGNASQNEVETYEEAEHQLPFKFRLMFFIFGVGGLIFVPIFKSITHLPPFMGILLSLGALWIFSEVVYNMFKRSVSQSMRRIPFILTRIDMPTILFFLGILMAVAALECVGVLHAAAALLDSE
ncbi:MAG: sodium:proton antiporter NhaD, partial [Opitutales bacterium]|nr:sodium:proton antiporter NhaD [Opitutales bacterium]